MGTNKKKQAKLAHNKKLAAQEETVASKLVMVAGNHKVTRLVTGRTECGLRLNDQAPKWSYGVAEDVTCDPCNGILPEVPPVLPEGVDINDNDAVVAALPVLDMEAFDEAHPK